MHDVLPFNHYQRHPMFINGQDSTNNLHGKNKLVWNPTAPENENTIKP